MKQKNFEMSGGIVGGRGMMVHPTEALLRKLPKTKTREIYLLFYVVDMVSPSTYHSLSPKIPFCSF